MDVKPSGRFETRHRPTSSWTRCPGWVLLTTITTTTAANISVENNKVLYPKSTKWRFVSFSSDDDRRHDVQMLGLEQWGQCVRHAHWDMDSARDSGQWSYMRRCCVLSSGVRSSNRLGSDLRSIFRKLILILVEMFNYTQREPDYISVAKDQRPLLELCLSWKVKPKSRRSTNQSESSVGGRRWWRQDVHKVL